MPIRVWNESVLDSYANLQNFFNSSSAIGEVLSKKDKVRSDRLIPVNPNLAFHWTVCQVTTAPFRWILALFVKIISGSAYLVGADGVGKQTKIATRCLMAGFNVYSEDPTKLFHIKDAYNDANEEGNIVNENRFIPEGRITDPRVKDIIFTNGIWFNHHNGICRGMSQWFIYLYLNTKNQFSDARSHMKALGKQFKQGGGMDPVLLQSININCGALLGLKIGARPEHCPLSSYVNPYEWKPSVWKSKPQEIIPNLQNLGLGAYYVGLPRHGTAYIKTSATQSFFFDPNVGIVEINGEAQGEKLYELLTTTTHNIDGFETTSAFSKYNSIELSPVTKTGAF